ncbi:Fic family protein [Chryseobacterium sp. S0630]|uniref:Fic family protein n=1 Tax=Chryseobacterium sp. S0630 TaxID=2957803 RepID=UPI000551F497|nr:Fic family protein [Chryseobacterium sp. S0630]MCP1301464.1 Fic family protein [Chryseobacterium sp. S0630]
MVEKTPQYIEDEETLKLSVKIRFSGEMKRIDDDYLYWDKVKYLSKETDPQKYWNAIKFYRNLRTNKIKFGKYYFKYFLTEYIQKSLHLFDLNIGGNLGSNIGIAETDKNKFVISSIMEEAIASSQMEGANTTRRKAKEIIQKELKPRTKSEQMIVNNFITMRHIVQNKNLDLTVDNLLTVHQLITNGTLENDKEEGNFRINDEIFVANYSNGDIVHIPPDHKEINELISDLCIFFNNEGEDFIHPIIKGIIIHFMIGWIHPFSDGNGRTARSIFYWYMLKRGYWLTEYLSISRIIKDTKTQYEKAYLYTENDENDLTYFINYNIKTMDKAFVALKNYIGEKQREVIQASKFLRIPNVNERQAQILKILNEDSDRIFNVKEIENRFKISSFTARQDLNGLAELGFLQIIKVNKIKNNYIKSKDFDTVLKTYSL